MSERKTVEDKIASQRELPSRPSSSLKTRRRRNRKVFSCTECNRRKQKCDRSVPCSNCVTRNKQSACHYGMESVKKQQLLEKGTNNSSNNERSFEVIKLASESIAQISAFGFAKSTSKNNTTLGILKEIWSHDKVMDPCFYLSMLPLTAMDNSRTREQYMSLIRQLPSKKVIGYLVKIYFLEVNHQYYPLDEGIFKEHLENWNGLSFSILKNPLALSGDMQFFPALLFQCLALALQFLPLEYDSILDSLKYAVDMSFDDVAGDYSQSGNSVLSLLGKPHATLITVQAGFLRTSFLKNYGMVPESWHSLSQTIRDAQEIGLHTSEYGKRNERLGNGFESQWLDELSRRVWWILRWWDIDMAMLLGRSTTIDRQDETPPFPIDAPVPTNRREIAPVPRTDSDPPTPLSILLWTSEVSAPMRDILVLEKDDPNQQDFAKVERMHNLIVQISPYCPPYLRTHNPDTSFDDHPDCYWLKRARSYLQSNAAFTVMALHRPYIFKNVSSRTLALKAALEVLRSLKTLLNLLSHKMFCLVLRTFDATILIAAMYILYPLENRDDLDDFLQQFEFAMECFNIMGDRNAMTKAALGILKAVHVRLKKSLITELHSAPCIESSSSNVNQRPSLDTTSLAPPQPINDLLCRNLSTIYEPKSAERTDIDEHGTFETGAAGGSEIMHFHGDFHGDSLWSFMNDYDA